MSDNFWRGAGYGLLCLFFLCLGALFWLAVQG